MKPAPFTSASESLQQLDLLSWTPPEPKIEPSPGWSKGSSRNGWHSHDDQPESRSGELDEAVRQRIEAVRQRIEALPERERR